MLDKLIVEEHTVSKGCLHGSQAGPLSDSPVSGMNFFCIYMRKFHPAYRDNFVVLTVAAVSLNFHSSNWASPLVSIYTKK